MTSIKWVVTLAAFAIASASAASAQGTLRIGMTASDIPLTTGQTEGLKKLREARKDLARVKTLRREAELRKK